MSQVGRIVTGAVLLFVLGTGCQSDKTPDQSDTSTPSCRSLAGTPVDDDGPLDCRESGVEFGRDVTACDRGSDLWTMTNGDGLFVLEGRRGQQWERIHTERLSTTRLWLECNSETVPPLCSDDAPGSCPKDWPSCDSLVGAVVADQPLGCTAGVEATLRREIPCEDGSTLVAMDAQPPIFLLGWLGHRWQQPTESWGEHEAMGACQPSKHVPCGPSGQADTDMPCRPGEKPQHRHAPVMSGA